MEGASQIRRLIKIAGTLHTILKSLRVQLDTVEPGWP